MIKLEVLIAISGALIAIAGFYIGRINSAKKQGATLATIESDVKNVLVAVADVKKELQQHSSQIMELSRKQGFLEGELKGMQERLNTLIGKTLHAN
ncbi:hypothetical protein FACS189425_09320 [Clostridia bacterium]|nr:hypothetical protein FACS189425_09320 [Clostridia bacterium]